MRNLSTTRNLGETGICNMPDRGFKVMIIRILTGLEKSGRYES